MTIPLRSRRTSPLTVALVLFLTAGILLAGTSLGNLASNPTAEAGTTHEDHSEVSLGSDAGANSDTVPAQPPVTSDRAGTAITTSQHGEGDAAPSASASSPTGDARQPLLNTTSGAMSSPHAAQALLALAATPPLSTRPAMLESTQNRVFAHPGTPLTRSDLQTLKGYIDQGRQPWKSAFDQLANDGKSKLDYPMNGPFQLVKRAPNVNLQPWRNDMVAIWNLSRMWYFTGNQDYAKKAREILLAWAHTHTEFSGRESMLDLGDYAYMFVGGADILRGTWKGWTDSDTAVVKDYFKNVLMPAANPYGENQFGAANKGALALTAIGLMAIYTDDAPTLDRVVYQVRTLAHIGLRSSNDLGMLGDSLRDQGHAHGQLKSLVMLAEALWKQGIDIYSDFNNRLLAAGEYFARVNELAPTPALPFGTTDAYYVSDQTNRGWSGGGGGNVVLNQLYNAYVLRKGLQAPFITQRRQWMPIDSNSFMFLQDPGTDTSKASPAPEVPIPSTSSITRGLTDTDIGDATPTGSATYKDGIWTVTGAGSDAWGSKDNNHFAYLPISGNGAIIAKVDSVGNTGPDPKAGVMMRTSLSPGSPRAWIAITSKARAEQNMPNLTVYGGTYYGNKVLPIASNKASYWVKLERIGNMITGFLSPDGTNWAATDVGRIDTPIPGTIYAGLMVASTLNGTPSTSIFSHVQVTGGDGKAPASTPGAPAAVLAAAGDGAVPLRWQQSFGATSYTIKRATAVNGPFTVIATNVTTSSYTDTTVTNGARYYYTVAASNAVGTSADSPIDSATPNHPALVNVALGGQPSDNAGNTDNATQAFDQNTGSEWFHTGVGGWLQYDLGHTVALQRYGISVSDVRSSRDPKSWQLQGSTNGTTWTTLDTQSGQVFLDRFRQQSYRIPQSLPYRYYRLNITANNGDTTFTAVSELTLLAPKPR